MSYFVNNLALGCLSLLFSAPPFASGTPFSAASDYDDRSVGKTTHHIHTHTDGAQRIAIKKCICKNQGPVPLYGHNSRCLPPCRGTRVVLRFPSAAQLAQRLTTMALDCARITIQRTELRLDSVASKRTFRLNTSRSGEWERFFLCVFVRTITFRNRWSFLCCMLLSYTFVLICWCVFSSI